MGNSCSSSGKVRNSDPNGSRRLSITHAPGPSADLPPNVSRDGTIPRGEDQWLFSCVSVAGTYFKPSGNPFKGTTQYKTNQDSYLVVEEFMGRPDEHLLGVLDGHGSQGHHASQFIAQLLPTVLADKVKGPAASMADLLGRTYLDVDYALEQSDINVMLSGSTVTTVHIKGNEVTCANAGDSRCVLGYVDKSRQLKAKDLSNDHKPDDPEEKKRIEANNGRVAPLESWPEGPKRVWLKREDMPGLAMSRSLGDRVAHSVGVSSEPEIITHTINPKTDEYLILASDGVWEFISSQEALDIVSRMPTPRSAAELLCKISVERWAIEEPVCDDITALVVFFNPIAI